MGKKIYFMDSVKTSDGGYNNTYGVDDMNSVVSNLVGAGIAPFESSSVYAVSYLNTLTSALVDDGVSLGGLKVSLNDNKIHIAQGICYFENGATIVVDSDGEELEYNVAETLYVYARYDAWLNMFGFFTAENEADIESIPDVGIYALLLATVEADGTVNDKRKFAQSKVATLGRNVKREFIIASRTGDDYNTDEYYCESSNGSDIIIWEKEIDISKFNLIRILLTINNGKGYYTDTVEKLIPITNTTVIDDVDVYVNNRLSVEMHMSFRYTDGKMQIYVPAKESEDTLMTVHSLRLILY